MLGCKPASPTQGLRHHALRYYTLFPIFFMAGDDLEKFGLVDQNGLERVSALLIAESAGREQATTIESFGGAVDRV